MTIRFADRVQQYEIFEVEARDLREALRAATERFPGNILGTADLAEIRLANPASTPKNGAVRGEIR
ncbi:MAG: hypothetical protein JSU87_02875 [Gemmatimonadota bacterium]|nr:MAG: hypothetical protein JSU87_02875 [Gemmatimonadota bacterium]